MNRVFSALRMAAILTCATGCGGPQKDFERTFERAVHFAVLTNGATIQLSSLTTFPWDKVFIFHPYITPEAIDKELGFKWSNAAKGELEYSDAFELLVFVRDGRVVKSARIHRKIGDWMLDNRNGFRPGEAAFVVNPPLGNMETAFRIRGTN